MHDERATNYQSTLEAEADNIRATEHVRLRALVEADMEVARQLHTPDFQWSPSTHPYMRICQLKPWQ